MLGFTWTDSRLSSSRYNQAVRFIAPSSVRPVRPSRLRKARVASGRRRSHRIASAGLEDGILGMRVNCYRSAGVSRGLDCGAERLTLASYPPSRAECLTGEQVRRRSPLAKSRSARRPPYVRDSVCAYSFTLRVRRIFNRERRMTTPIGRFIAGAKVAPSLAMLTEAPFNTITGEILSAAIEVHRTLGPGLLESTYAPCLLFELNARKLRFVTQRAIPIVYKGMQLDASYRVDLIVEDVVVVEMKAVAALSPVHQAQVLTYMKLTDCPAGLLINFNVPRLMDGVKRWCCRGNRGDRMNGFTQRNWETKTTSFEENLRCSVTPCEPVASARSVASAATARATQARRQNSGFDGLRPWRQGDRFWRRHHLSSGRRSARRRRVGFRAVWRATCKRGWPCPGRAD